MVSADCSAFILTQKELPVNAIKKGKSVSSCLFSSSENTSEAKPHCHKPVWLNSCAEFLTYAAAVLPALAFPLDFVSSTEVFSLSTNSITAMGAASPGLLRVGTMRVYPPVRDENLGPS